ncbi:flagellar hook-basal body protein FliE [Legionella massiliensis]|uniref:Flagellar hook-basal body complex protein FliE n=1 Tax=Legionella massiliensis TaxID=1034943 RepID=A0A078KVN1_9GAMM|nr:flagellar hook-basal body complex protein FliE [Legionella massiliensis]CDZ77062.1 flagellar hook-basal body protein FliE [Legionella massiliensis]CEE12800.1 Flagellar hook-basal body complex protein FliE [Legionella massiliensis]
MKIEAMDSIYLNSGIRGPEQSAAATPSFANWLQGKVSETNEHLLNADQALQQLASGQAPSLHQTMLSLEQAKLSFQFLEQLRNRLMSAYQELLREQI